VLTIEDWDAPVAFFVGRNGSGKSRAARAVARKLDGKLLSTDRLLGLMTVSQHEWGAAPRADLRGVPIKLMDSNIISMSREHGIATADVLAMREQPDVLLSVAAFIRRALGRQIEMRETAGFIDPWVRNASGESYSLLRDEGHGLRELVVLLTAAYRSDWELLVVDEPELHLHPSMARLWLAELERRCRETGQRAIVVSHSPALLRPTSSDDLKSIWCFAPGRPAIRLSDCILAEQQHRVTHSLAANPTLVADLVFSPRPVLVEGPTDVAALTTSLERTMPTEVVVQTDLVECGGAGGVALWYEIAQQLGLDVRAVADLDAVFSHEVRRAMDGNPLVQDAYRLRLAAEPPTTSAAVNPLVSAIGNAGVEANPKARAAWLADGNLHGTGHQQRLEMLLEIWREVGLWVHPQGTLEAVLGIGTKGVPQAIAAAGAPGPIDDVARWAAFQLDPSGELELLLNAEAERIAQALMVATRVSPGTVFGGPVGTNAEADARLVDVVPLETPGAYRLVVKSPQQFAGWTTEFSRQTPPDDIVLRPPQAE
jgi:hypothetical protein